jgi:hypothetical protein
VSAVPLPDYNPVTLREQIACVRRELALRRNVYNRQIARGTLHPGAAGEELQKMQSVLRTLEQLAAEKGWDWIPAKAA